MVEVITQFQRQILVILYPLKTIRGFRFYWMQAVQMNRGMLHSFYSLSHYEKIDDRDPKTWLNGKLRNVSLGQM